MAVFELNQGAHHDHIVCVDCGKWKSSMDGGIEEPSTAVAKRLGFEISDHALILYGHCRKTNCPSETHPRHLPKPSVQSSVRRITATGCAIPTATSCASPFLQVFAGHGSAKHVARMRTGLLGDIDSAEHPGNFVGALRGAQWFDRRARDLAVAQLGDAKLTVSLGRRPARDVSRTALEPARPLAQLAPEISATAPPMPASTSSNTMQSGEEEARPATCTARLMRDSSPPEATLARLLSGCPGLHSPEIPPHRCRKQKIPNRPG